MLSLQQIINLTLRGAYPISFKQSNSLAMRDGLLVGIRYFKANSCFFALCFVAALNTLLNVPINKKEGIFKSSLVNSLKENRNI